MSRLPVMSVAHEARSIAQQLTNEHHIHLLEADILYVFTDQKRKRCDRVRLGSAAKLSALQRFLASGLDGVDEGPDFVILLDSTLWVELGAAARIALVDHELCHCALFVSELAEAPRTWRRFDPQLDALPIDEERYEWRWGLRAHDVEEFADVLKRHGFWRVDPQEQAFQEIALQLVMPTNGRVKSKGDA